MALLMWHFLLPKCNSGDGAELKLPMRSREDGGGGCFSKELP